MWVGVGVSVWVWVCVCVVHPFLCGWTDGLEMERVGISTDEVGCKGNPPGGWKEGGKGDGGVREEGSWR